MCRTVCVGLYVQVCVVGKGTLSSSTSRNRNDSCKHHTAKRVHTSPSTPHRFVQPRCSHSDPHYRRQHPMTIYPNAMQFLTIHTSSSSNILHTRRSSHRRQHPRRDDSAYHHLASMTTYTTSTSEGLHPAPTKIPTRPSSPFHNPTHLVAPVKVKNSHHRYQLSMTQKTHPTSAHPYRLTRRASTFQDTAHLFAPVEVHTTIANIPWHRRSVPEQYTRPCTHIDPHHHTTIVDIPRHGPSRCTREDPRLGTFGGFRATPTPFRPPRGRPHTRVCCGDSGCPVSVCWYRGGYPSVDKQLP